MATSSFTTNFQFTKKNAANLLDAINDSKHVDISEHHKIKYWNETDIKRRKDRLKQIFK